MRITGARIALNARKTVGRDLWIACGRVSFSPISSSSPRVLDLSGFLILPGLVNAHDHLEWNLLPRLGRGIYPNAAAWAEDIYHPHKSPVQEHLAVPKNARLRWGAMKNLLSGVTTVAHHNPPPPRAIRSQLPIRLLSRYGWAHSLHFSPDWQRRFKATPKQYPFIMHVAEGTDEASRREIKALENASALASSTLLVHGVAIRRKELAVIAGAGCSLVWCPSSNRFTLGKTLDREVLESGVPIALGSDSAMTANGDLLDELHFAEKLASPERLYAMVTSAAARILKLPAGFGEICDGGPADLLAIRDEGLTPAESLLRAVPQLVMVGGRIELISGDCGIRGPRELRKTSAYIEVGGRGGYFFSRPGERLINRTSDALPTGIKLAGKAISSWKT